MDFLCHGSHTLSVLILSLNPPKSANVWDCLVPHILINTWYYQPIKYCKSDWKEAVSHFSVFLFNSEVGHLLICLFTGHLQFILWELCVHIFLPVSSIFLWLFFLVIYIYTFTLYCYYYYYLYSLQTFSFM